MPTTPPPIKARTLVYSRTGEKARYVAPLPGNHHCVTPYVLIYINDADGGYDEEQEGNITQWPEVFLQAPRAVLDAEIVALNREIETRHAELNTIRAANQAQEAEIRARRDRIKQHEKLRLLDDYISGRITHYVVKEYSGISILKAEDAIEQRDREWYDKKLRLLCLYGDTKGDLSWGLSAYRDGSGGSSAVYPVCSYDEGLAIAAKMLTAEFDQWRKAEHRKAYSVKGYVTTAIKLGLAVPQDVLDHEAEYAVAAALKGIETARKVLANAEAELIKVAPPLPLLPSSS